MSVMSPRPNFFLIGAPKCGTTTLWKCLKSHSKIFMCTPKEPHYFSRLSRGDPERAWEDYIDLFRGATDEPVVGEASTSSLMKPESASYIYDRIGEEVYLLAILRDPVERAFSHYLHFVRAGAEHDTFEEAIRKEEKRLENGTPVTHAYRNLGMYGSRLAPFYEYFGSDRIKVVLFEDFIDRPGDILREIGHFLGIDASFDVEKGLQENHRPPSTSRRAQVLDWLCAGWYQYGIHRGRVFRAIDRYIVRNHQPQLAPRPEVRRQLFETYAEDLRRLSSLTGIDTDRWHDFDLNGRID